MKNVCKMLENENLVPYSSMKTGGKAKELYIPETRQQLEALLYSFLKEDRRFVVFGNLLPGNHPGSRRLQLLPCNRNQVDCPNYK